MIIEESVPDVDILPVENISESTNVDVDKLIEEFANAKIMKLYGQIPLDSKFKIQHNNVFGKCYRVNIWSETLKSGRVVPTFSIVDSFLLELRNAKIVDITI